MYIRDCIGVCIHMMYVAVYMVLYRVYIKPLFGTRCIQNEQCMRQPLECHSVRPDKFSVCQTKSVYVRVHRCILVECMRQPLECHSVRPEKSSVCQITSMYVRVHRCILIEYAR